MTGIRKTLSLRLDARTPEEKEAETAAILSRAIEYHLCVRWTYNRLLMQAAPQILYRKNGGLYLDAIVKERGGSAVVEEKLASFKLTGLVAPTLTTQSFDPDMTFDLSAERYRDGIIARAVR